MAEMWFDSVEDYEKPVPSFLVKEIEKDARESEQGKFTNIRVNIIMVEHSISL